MMYDDMYPDMEPLDCTEQDIMKTRVPGPCWNCGVTTQFMDLDFEAYLCSPQCSYDKWAEYQEDSIRSDLVNLARRARGAIEDETALYVSSEEYKLLMDTPDPAWNAAVLTIWREVGQRRLPLSLPVVVDSVPIHRGGFEEGTNA